MAEQHINVEVAHKLSEREESARSKRRWEEVVEIFEVVLLALAAIATAWGGYQAARGDGTQSVLYNDANAIRLEATAAASLGEQRLAADSAIFNTWLEARTANDQELQAILVRRFSPEYRAAFTAWLAADPFDDPAAPPGPGYMAEYQNPEIAKAGELNHRAAEMQHEGTEARHTAEEYVRATVLFALVLFLVAVGQRFRLFGVRIATLVLALALFSYAIYEIATLPRL